MSESLLAETIEPAENKLPEYISLAYLPSPGVVKLRLTARGENESKLKDATDYFAAEIKNLLGENVYADEPISLEEYTGRLMKNHHLTIAVAESCTGGKIAHKITSVPGSSAYFLGSMVTYSNELKMNLLGVKNQTISEFGAVSRQTVDEMLSGAFDKMSPDLAIAVSGIAGPDGGSAEKPVGTIFIAVATREESRIKKYFFNKNRDVNIEYACMFALHELRLLLEQLIAKKAV